MLGALGHNGGMVAHIQHDHTWSVLLADQLMTPHVHPDLAGLWPGPEIPIIRQRLLAFCAVPLAQAAELGATILTTTEKERAAKMKDRRRVAFIAARAALKMLHYDLGAAGANQPPRAIETVAADGVRPLAPQYGEYQVYVSASHGPAWAAAAAGRGPLGLDVELLTDKALRGNKVFMSESEKKVVGSCGLPAEEAALRVWSIKEAAAKALNLELAVSWSKVRVQEIGPDFSVLSITRQRLTAAHDMLEQHLFTLLPA